LCATTDQKRELQGSWIDVGLADRLEADLKAAMVAGDSRKRDVIRYLRAEVKNESIEQRRELTDAEIEGVVRHQIKQRRDSIDMFRKGGRDDLANEEEAQATVLQSYLPEQMSEAEVRAIVQRIAADIDARSARDMSKLMSLLMQATEGRAEGRLLSQLARQELERRSAAGDDQ
jgi:uncharacterized protein YqeY